MLHNNNNNKINKCNTKLNLYFTYALFTYIHTCIYTYICANKRAYICIKLRFYLNSRL